ncbi:MAG: hypothetical protein O7D91_20295 [Planctomycetota bacterium]|nr:hypothetical protein [Planctomycetota bacterium]
MITKLLRVYGVGMALIAFSSPFALGADGERGAVIGDKNVTVVNGAGPKASIQRELQIGNLVLYETDEDSIATVVTDVGVTTFNTTDRTFTYVSDEGDEWSGKVETIVNETEGVGVSTVTFDNGTEYRVIIEVSKANPATGTLRVIDAKTAELTEIQVDADNQTLTVTSTASSVGQRGVTDFGASAAAVVIGVTGLVVIIDLLIDRPYLCDTWWHRFWNGCD